MRYFALLNLQHVVLYIFPTLIFIVVLGLALAKSYYKSADSPDRLIKVHGRYPDDLEDKDAPFPVALTLIIVGTAVWAVLYILFTGLMGVQI
ncbi:MAG: hypothetical protein AB1427_03150 [Thermodesulfobacteriota bacterium]